jgi:hypothetical protein
VLPDAQGGISTGVQAVQLRGLAHLAATASPWLANRAGRTAQHGAAACAGQPPPGHVP